MKQREINMDKATMDDFAKYCEEGVKDAKAAVEVFKLAVEEAELLAGSIGGFTSIDEVEKFMEARCNVNALTYTLLTLVAPLREIPGGMKPKHALAMYEAAVDCDRLASQIERAAHWQAMVDHLGRDNLIEQIMDVVAARRAGKPN